MWVQLKDQSTGGFHFQSLESTEGRRPRVVQKEWGGVSSFLAVFTLGLLFVDFRTFYQPFWDHFSSPDNRMVAIMVGSCV